MRAAFRATAELRREDFKMNYNQVVAAGIAAIGTTLKVELDIQAVQGRACRWGEGPGRGVRTRSVAGGPGAWRADPGRS